MYKSGGDKFDIYFPPFYMFVCVGIAAVCCLIVQLSDIADESEDHLFVENNARLMHLFYFPIMLVLTYTLFYILLP